MVPPEMFLQHSLLPVGKGKIFKGPRTIFIEQAKRMN
jgi:hypothetical protein